MPQKNAPSSAEPAQAIERELVLHIRALGLETVEEYRHWCGEIGLSRKLQKNWKQRCRERSLIHQAHADVRLARKKRETRCTDEILTAICNRQLNECNVTEPNLRQLCHSIRIGSDARHERLVNRSALLRLLLHVRGVRAKLFDGSPAIGQRGTQPGNSLIEALPLIAAHQRSWLRPIETWRPRTYSARRQFASLLRHLFVRYEMPAFFDAVWLAGRDRNAQEQRSWYPHVGRGQNIRHCALPIAYTKKMAHEFMRAPNDVTVMQALRWGQILGLGGNEGLARAVLGTRLGEAFDNEDFWATVIRWFLAHPMLDRAHVGPIIDYLHHLRFVPVAQGAAGHRHEQGSPPQPNLSMRGRTPQSVLKGVTAWHRELAVHNVRQVQQWDASGLETFVLHESATKFGGQRCWTIRELLSSKALFAEGRQMRHCVATYAASCARGACSIWTMEVESAEGLRKLLTIELRPRQRLVCQARGKANRMPSEKERSVLRRWAATAGLTIARDV